MSAKLAGLDRMSNLSKVEELCKANSSTAFNVAGGWTYTNIPNGQFTLPKGDWLITIYVYLISTANSNYWISVNDGADLTIYSVNPSRITTQNSYVENAAMFFHVDADTVFTSQISSAAAQSITPYGFLIQAYKLND